MSGKEAIDDIIRKEHELQRNLLDAQQVILDQIQERLVELDRKYQLELERKKSAIDDYILELREEKEVELKQLKQFFDDKQLAIKNALDSRMEVIIEEIESIFSW